MMTDLGPGWVDRFTAECRERDPRAKPAIDMAPPTTTHWRRNADAAQASRLRGAHARSKRRLPETFMPEDFGDE